MGEAARIERIPPDRAPSPGPFPAALLRGEGPASRFLPVLPRDDAAWGTALTRARREASRPPADLVLAVAARQTALGLGPRAVAAARALAEPDAVAVVTGQQPGLLGGPLMTFHKAAGAIHLARRLAALDGRPVVPVFWLASEDHDFDEANRACLLDRDGRPRRLSLPGEADGRSLMDRTVDRAAAAALREEVAGILPDTERARAALASLPEPDEGEDLATWSARQLASLLGDAGLVIVEPPVLLPFAGDALARLLERHAEVRAALDGARRALEAAGLAAPLAPAPGEAPLFLREERGGPRLRVTVTPGGEVLLRGRASGLDVAEVARRIREDPFLASGDAAGRVLVQDLLLPVLAYVGGPTELAYHAEVAAARPAVGLGPSLAVPRPAATWLEPKIEKNVRAFGLDLAALLSDPALLDRSAVPDAEERAALERALAAWAARLGTETEDLRPYVQGGGEVARALARAGERVAGAARESAPSVLAAFDRDRGVGADRRRRLHDWLWPRDRPQERVLSPLSLVARHGVEAFREGLAGLDPLAEGHHLVHLLGAGG